MPDTVIELDKLTKAYGETIAVNELSMQIEQGEIFGFLGPNGAGKTTTILMLMGLTEPSSGIAKVAGYQLPRQGIKIRRLAGYLPENVGFYDDMTAYQNLLYTARLNSIPRGESENKVTDVLAAVGLKDVSDKKVGKFSKGMKQRLGIADVLIKEPSVAFLDEPTAGVDPEGVKLILGLIRNLSEEKKTTVMLSSHLLYQVQRICHRVGIIAKGRLVAYGSIERLGKEALKGGDLTIEVQLAEKSESRALLEDLRSLPSVKDVHRSGSALSVRCGEDVRPLIAKKIVEQGAQLLEMKLRDSSLEEIYTRYFRET
ncbi:MAG: ABC transporter ATP-binding protein [Thaumarchaeota archaeon]|nr:ABC transporter ATP-binding protein [Nitrososphaerota archaeon]